MYCTESGGGPLYQVLCQCTTRDGYKLPELSPTRRLGHWAKLNRRQIANSLTENREQNLDYERIAAYTDRLENRIASSLVTIHPDHKTRLRLAQ
jgi:hypothetical protein